MLKAIGAAALAIAFVVGFFFLSTFVGMITRAGRIASWMLAWSMHNFLITGILLLAGYVIYKWLRTR